MILAPDAIESWAQKLDEAEQTRQTIPLLSASAEGLTVADSYAVQRAWVDRKVARGRRVIGHKIGLTSRAMQLASGIDEPDFGILLDDMLHYGGARLAADAFLTPRLEVELAFALKAPIQGPGVTRSTCFPPRPGWRRTWNTSMRASSSRTEKAVAGARSSTPSRIPPRMRR